MQGYCCSKLKTKSYKEEKIAFTYEPDKKKWLKLIL